MDYSDSTSQESQESELPAIGILYIVLQPAEMDLRVWLETNPGRPWHKVSTMMHGAASGLQYLHGLSLIHRDLTPKNILVQDQKLLLSDFGLIR